MKTLENSLQLGYINLALSEQVPLTTSTSAYNLYRLKPFVTVLGTLPLNNEPAMRYQTRSNASAQPQSQASVASPTSTISSAPPSPTALTPPPATQARLFSPEPIVPQTPASSTIPDKPAPGAAFILGVGILENPRCPETSKTRSILFDVSFCVGSMDAPPLTGCLKFFNNLNLDFSDPEMRAKYVVFASVAACQERAELFATPGRTWKDYDVVGDIIWLASAQDADATRQRPLIITSGQTGHVNTNRDSFELSASQYVQQLRGSGSLAATVSLADNPRFKNSSKKPLPSANGTNTLVVGSLEGIRRLPTFTMESFQLALESVVYYPRALSAPLYQPGTPTPSSGSHRMGRPLRFQDINTRQSRSPMKRPRVDQADDDSSDDAPLAGCPNQKDDNNNNTQSAGRGTEEVAR
ncbi:hypothetical protein C8Q80DRAFT_1137012 [Daedaleopsis nitida]|nr:hypothetical protein C8Q80DRAFT_1137012 [Daedaleopsis nitida]